MATLEYPIAPGFEPEDLDNATMEDLQAWASRVRDELKSRKVETEPAKTPKNRKRIEKA